MELKLTDFNYIFAFWLKGKREKVTKRERKDSEKTHNEMPTIQ